MNQAQTQTIELLKPWCGSKNQDTGTWHFEGICLENFDEDISDGELSSQVDGRSLLDLEATIKDAVEQIYVRANLGQSEAIEKYANIIRSLVGDLGELTKRHESQVGEQAEQYNDWPVLLRPTQKSFSSIKESLKKLGVGKKSRIPTRKTEHIDQTNFGTELADKAYEACRKNRRLIPELLALAKGVNGIRLSFKFWQIKEKATFYELANGDTLLITDSQKNCVNLPEPISSANFIDWWTAVKMCVLEHWYKNPKEYTDAINWASYGDTASKKDLSAAGKREDKTSESRKRGHAVNQVKKAFVSLINLKELRQQPPSTT